MRLYPAIDILGGNAVRLVKGDFDAKTVIPGVMSLVRKLLNPIAEAPGDTDDPSPVIDKPIANKDAEPRR